MAKEYELELNGVTTSYGQSQILWGVNLKAEKAKVTTVMGRNGVGKTTLLKTIIGLLNTNDGLMDYKGTDLTKVANHKRAKLGLGYVPQGREIIPKLTVYENIKLGLEANPDSKAKIPEEEIYELFPILKDFRKRLGGNLSGGQQQQLAIARTLTGNPSMILLDEPTEGIQPSITQDIAKILLRLVEEKGISILLVEQKIDFARSVTDYYYFMDRGKMIHEGSKEDLSMEEISNYVSV